MISFKQYLINESKLLEGKQEFLKKYQAKLDVKDIVNKFWIIRQRLKAPQNDIDYWIKQPYDEFKKFVIGFDVSKNKSARKQDNYTKEAEKWGAVMFGVFGPYEAWFVPTHEAAVQLGRFYKNISTKWCISTNASEYFYDRYEDSEFIFLISDDKSLNEYQKIALQLDANKDLEAVWDINDENIFDDIPEFLEQPINNAIYEFSKLNRSRHDDAIKSLIAKQAEYLKKNANKIVLQLLNRHQVITFDTFPQKVRNNITLSHIDIPNTVTEIGESAFGKCTSLQSITIPNSVTKIGTAAFNECTSLQSITIPNSVTTLDAFAFKDCSSLKSITLSDSISTINYGSFRECTSLQSIVIPKSVKSIKEKAFIHCSSLKSIVLPNSISEIEDAAFSLCPSLESITLPVSISEIADKLFFGSGIKTLIIPDSVKSIKFYPFSECKSLKQVIFSSNSPLIDQIKNEEYGYWGLTKKQIFISK